MKRKVFGLRVFLFFFDYRKKRAFNLEKTKKILFMHSRYFIGDAIVSTGIYKILKDNNYTVDILAAPNNKIIFDLNNKDLNKIFILKKGIINLFKTAFKLKKEKYDLVIDLNPKITRLEFLLIKTINAKSVLSFDERDMNLFNVNMIALKKNTSFDKIHIINRYKAILDLFDIKNADLNYLLPVPKEIENEVEKFLKANSTKKYICIVPFGSFAGKNMTNNQINKIVYFINKHYPDYRIIFIGLPKEVEIFKALPNSICNPFKNFTNSIELIRKSNLVISTDTSLVHVASAYKKSIIAIYRNRKQTLKWTPNNPNAITIIGKDKDTIENINPNKINEKIVEILKS